MIKQNKKSLAVRPIPPREKHLERRADKKECSELISRLSGDLSVAGDKQKNNIDISRIKGTVRNLTPFMTYLSEINNNKKVLAADIPQMIERGLKDGQLCFSQDKYGHILAQIKDKNGKIAHNLRLKESTLPTSNVSMVQNMILQQQLAEIQSQLEVLQRSVDLILKEMHLDRCAKIVAAVKQTENAISLPEKDQYRVPLFVAASTLALEGMEEIKAVVENRVKLLCAMKEKGGFSAVWTKHPQKEVDQHVRMLCGQIQDLHYAAFSVAYIYVHLGRPQFADNVLRDYKKFLDSTLTREVILELNSQAGNVPEIKAWNEGRNIIRRKLDDYLTVVEKCAPKELDYGGN